jgi:hypothetical protein
VIVKQAPGVELTIFRLTKVLMRCPDRIAEEFGPSHESLILLSSIYTHLEQFVTSITNVLQKTECSSCSGFNAMEVPL